MMPTHPGNGLAATEWLGWVAWGDVLAAAGGGGKRRWRRRQRRWVVRPGSRVLLLLRSIVIVSVGQPDAAAAMGGSWFVAALGLALCQARRSVSGSQTGQSEGGPWAGRGGRLPHHHPPWTGQSEGGPWAGRGGRLPHHHPPWTTGPPGEGDKS